ncbi:hypothetical protein ACFXAE_09030 [Streptomyces sp. NPDC059454]
MGLVLDFSWRTGPACGGSTDLALRVPDSAVPLTAPEPSPATTTP